MPFGHKASWRTKDAIPRSQASDIDDIEIVVEGNFAGYRSRTDLYQERVVNNRNNDNSRLKIH